MATIKVGIGRTYNTGNYTSLRLDVEISEDGRYEDIDEGFDIIYDMVKSLLAKAEKDQGVS